MFSQIKDIKHMARDSRFVAWFMPPEVRLGCWPSKHYFFKTCSCVISNYGDDELNRIQAKFSSSGQTGDLGVGSKGQVSLKFNYKVNFKDFYTKLCGCSYKLKI